MQLNTHMFLNSPQEDKPAVSHPVSFAGCSQIPCPPLSFYVVFVRLSDLLGLITQHAGANMQ